MANNLDSGSSRLGWYFDGLPDEISPRHQVMLRNDEGRVSVTALVEHDAPLARYFKAEFASEPLLDPPPSGVGYFIDARGSVALAGGRYGIGAIGSAIEGRISFDYAVLGGSGLEYERINSLHTSIEHLGRWMNNVGPRTELVLDEGGKVVGITATAELGTEVRLSPKLNLCVSHGWAEEPQLDAVTLRTSQADAHFGSGDSLALVGPHHRPPTLLRPHDACRRSTAGFYLCSGKRRTRSRREPQS